MPVTASEEFGSEEIYGKSFSPIPQPLSNSQIITVFDSVLPKDHEETPKTNGYEITLNDSEPPLKRRRVSDSAQLSLNRKKPESPPWKKIVAEGPSSFTQDGVRKSGRTNVIPLELQPPSNKRQTRGAVQKTYSAKDKYKNSKKGRASLPATLKQEAAASSNSVKRPASSGKSENHFYMKSPAKPTSSPKRSARFSHPYETSPTLARLSKMKPQQQSGDHPDQTYKPRRVRRTSEVVSAPTMNGTSSYEASDVHDYSPGNKLPRIRFRVKPPKLPLVHPDLVPRKPKKYPVFKDFFERSGVIPVEDGGLLSTEEDLLYTDEMAKKEAMLISRMEEAAKDGGVLSSRISSAYQPRDLEQDNRKLLRQYSHQDHLIRAATGFRLLMVDERKKHERNAKRLAEACRDEWYRKQPKTLDQLEAEATKAAEARYKALVKTMQLTWDNVKAEVNKRRLQQWEADELIRIRRTLNEAVDISTQMIEARRARNDSDLPSEGDDSDMSISNEDDPGSEAESDSNMSSSESDADEERHGPGLADDEQLTVEELRLKYAKLPEKSTTVEDRGDHESQMEIASGLEVADVDTPDESDESVDMDDDMGSSDEGQGSEGDGEDEDEDEDEDESDNEEQGVSSLLGFLAPSDLASMGIDSKRAISSAADDESSFEGDSNDSKDEDAINENDEDLVDEDDEVSLIPDEAYAQALSVSNAEEREMAVDAEMEESRAELNGHHRSPEIGVDIGSADRSSQPTPGTVDTKPSDVESASSVELQQKSRQPTHSATPQPSIHLKTPIPFLLRGTLREYQHYGLDWLAGLYANNTNGILADEMGLGKTIQTIALLAHLACEHEVWGPHLVIVPTSVMLNWEMEFKKWCPGFKILTYYGTQEERKRKRQGWNDADTWNVCITSYQLVLQDQQVFKRRQWHYLILDEAHNIKNFKSKRWQTLLNFNTRARLLLTGTPLQNNITELWSLLFFLEPGKQNAEGFADLKEFSDWFGKPQDQILRSGRDKLDDDDLALISKLHRFLRPYLLRRMKADVEKQMPAKYEHVEYCRLSRRQRELYDGFLSRSETRGTLASGSYLSIINCLMQLRKVCNHPDLFLERPILSSFPMPKSAIADFEIKDLLVRRKLLREDPMKRASLDFLNLVPTKYEHLSGSINERSSMLTAQRVLMDMREAQRLRAQYALTSMDPSTIKSNLVFLEMASRWSRFEELQHCVYLNALRRQQKPIYGRQLVDLLDLGISLKSVRKKPSRRHLVLDWLQESDSVMNFMIPTLQQRAEALEPTIKKFACITPPIVTPDALPIILGRQGVEYFQTEQSEPHSDPFHESRMRLSVQFPDKRLLQYDCGKLQTLDKLLRKLQSGGHRALIFTQMTKVLDILEQFLNIHGHRYLRLDGATKIEQRQILTDRFNNDTRILAFILSSRSGGLGINLTGADTVIFYDLDWNPAMDKQCQDRCHRIGQTRDVHIYRLVSEHTIEANILRKANQKRMLDDVVIQEGDFTTDYFNKMSVRDVLGDDVDLLDGDDAANAAMDRVLGGPGDEGDMQGVLAQAEDQEDVAAARVAQQEEVQTDAADFDERLATGTVTPKTSGQDTPMEDVMTPAVVSTPGAEVGTSGIGSVIDPDDDEVNAWGQRIESTDHYMLKLMTEELRDSPLDLPKDKGKIHRNRVVHRLW